SSCCVASVGATTSANQVATSAPASATQPKTVSQAGLPAYCSLFLTAMHLSSAAGVSGRTASAPLIVDRTAWDVCHETVPRHTAHRLPVNLPAGTGRC